MHDEGLYIEQKKKISSLGIKPTGQIIEPHMPTKSHDDGTIDELLRLAGVSTENSGARSWLESPSCGSFNWRSSAAAPTPGKAQCPTR